MVLAGRHGLGDGVAAGDTTKFSVCLRRRWAFIESKVHFSTKESLITSVVPSVVSLSPALLCSRKCMLGRSSAYGLPPAKGLVDDLRKSAALDAGPP